MLGRFFFWKCVYQLPFLCIRERIRCVPLMVWWWTGMNNWLGEKTERAAGGGRRGGGGRGQGVPERSWEFSISSFSSSSFTLTSSDTEIEIQSHLQYVVLHHCSVSVMLVWTALLFVHLHFVLLCILDDSNTALSRPFLGHCFSVKPCQNATLCCFLQLCFRCQETIFSDNPNCLTCLTC